MNKEILENGLEIAVIGMAGRFPGASDIWRFWENLKNSVESVTFFTERELEEAGVDSRLLQDPNYVKANGMLECIDRFDASFFGYTPLEASAMDPQIRIFHECAWEALEDAGYDPDTYKGLIGCYAGATPHFDWEALTALSEKSLELGEFVVEALAQKDFLSTRISYKFNLKGPSFTLYTGCSTSLTAVHVACQAILNGECGMALAGGVTAIRTSKKGYWYKEGLIRSPDGHCRAFDINAQGIVGGDGAGVVVLKRFQDAIAEGDHIYAVIKGSAINNDGIRKVGFTAPSVQGQAEAIRIAQMMAEVDPETITYVETHGTGTPLGDPVEIEALKLAFNTDKKRFCAIGSVKTNVGHLDSAAGVTGLIKTVLALKYKLIPPSLHFERPNPKLGIEDSPFYVNTTLKKWQSNGRPLRGAVSSFGIGGTNAHVILEEAPAIEHSLSPSLSREYEMIMLSAKTKPALDRGAEKLARYLKVDPGISLADIAYTLQVGRKAFSHRKVLVCSRAQEVVEALVTPGSGEVYSAVCREENHPIIFMFPGQGAQYMNMGRDLYRSEPVFRAEMDRCFEIVKPLLAYDIKEIIYSSDKSDQSNHSNRINQTEIAQPVIFIIEYALARLLIHWGITPYAMIGHSIGEYTAACLAGVFSLEDALKIVVHRGQLMQKIPGGSMLSVPLPEEELKPLLAQHQNLSLAAVNSPSRCVVSGNKEAIETFAAKLITLGYEGTLLHTSHAFHSAMMDPVLEEFGEEVKKIKLNKPKIPYLSNVSGSWIANDEVIDPGYWVRHLRSTVRFADDVSRLLKIAGAVLVEVGPGKTLSTFARQDIHEDPAPRVLNLVKPPLENLPDSRYLLTKIAQLWLYGGEIDWSAFYSGEKRRRISLPTYSFEAQHHPTEGDPYQIVRGMISGSVLQWERRTPDIADWFYTPSWQPSPLPALMSTTGDKTETGPLTWLVFIDETGVGLRLAEMLEQDHQKVITAKAGPDFTRENEGAYVIDPHSDEDYNILFKELKESNRVPHRVVHCWTVDRLGRVPEIETIDQSLDTGLYSLLGISKALGLQRISHPLHIQVISRNIQDVTGEEELEPHKATLLGAIKVIPLEYRNVTCSSIDIVLPEQGTSGEEAFFRHLWAELMVRPIDKLVAYRENLRQVQQIKPIHLDRSGEIFQRFREKGVYLIIGGFGGMGFSIAEYLGKNFQARLILVGRSAFPPRDEWSQWLETHESTDEKSRKIKILREMEESGAEVMIFNTDVAEYPQMKIAFEQSAKRFGSLNGVLHTAGVVDFGGAIQGRSREITRKYMASKVIGTLVLERLLNETQAKLDFLGLFSSLGNTLYKTKFGEVSYNAANEFMDAYTLYRSRQDKTFTVTINWCDWSEVGMTVNAIKQDYAGKEDKIDFKSMIQRGVNPTEGVEAFTRIMEHSQRRVIVYSYDLEHAIREQERSIDRERKSAVIVEESRPAPAVVLNQRPELSSEYVPPSTDSEHVLVRIWENFFGIQKIGVTDDFFELGGDSLKALAIIPHINKELEVNITLTDILLFTTIRALAATVHEESIFSKLECIVKLNKGRNKKNIFIIHPMHGMVYQYKELAKELQDTFNVFGIQARNLVRNSKFPETMQIMVHDYIHQMRQIQEEGPYVIGGYCFGDPVGYRLVKQLEDMGFPVELFIMFDEPFFIPEKVLWFYRQKDRCKKIITSLKNIWPQNKKIKREHPIWAKYREYEDGVEKKSANDESEREIPAEEIEKQKVEIEKKIERMYAIYIHQSAYKRTTGIIHTPILDIKAKNSHFKVVEEPLKKMTYGNLTVEESGGDHLTMFEQPYVKTMAEIIKKHVSR